MRRLSLPRFAPFALAALLAHPALADEVTLLPGAALKVPGGKLTGQITAETPTTLTIGPPGGTAQNVPVEAIASVTYTGQPASFTLAESRVAAGNLADALDQYARAAQDAAGRPLIAQTAQFARARALAELAKGDPKRANEAIAALDGFVRANPRSRHLGLALETLARLSLARKDAARAGTAAAQLAAIPWAADRAAVLQARVQSLQGQADAAGKTLDALIAKLPAASPARAEARLIRAEVMAAGGNPAEAEAAAREVISEADPEAAEIQAQAHNTLGDCLRAGGKPKDALFAYLETDILYDADKEQHARALAAIGALWRELKQPERADEALARLKSLYPQSPYTAAATAPARP
jgi:tetratricopeptide (TPR) repeat protein